MKKTPPFSSSLRARLINGATAANLVALTALALAPAPALAATTNYTWANAGQTDWAGTSSWLGTTAHPTGNNDAANFAGTAVSNPLLSVSSTANSLNFLSTATGYDIASTGTDITLTLAGATAITSSNPAGVNTIDTALSFAYSGTQSITLASGGTLILNGQITSSQAANSLKFLGIAATSASTSKVIITNTNNTFSGGVNLANGVTVSVAYLGNDGATGALGTGTITIGSGGSAGAPVLNYTGAGETTNKNIVIQNTSSNVYARVIDTTGATGNLILSGTITGLASTTSAAGSTLVLTGVNTGDAITGQIIQSSGTWTGSFTLGLIKAGTGTWTLSGSNSYTSTTFIDQGNLVLDYSTTGTNVVNSASALRFGNYYNNQGVYYALPAATSGTLTLKGAAGAADSQTFNGLNACGSGAAHILIAPGTGGSMTLNTGLISGTHSAGSTLDITTNGQTVYASTSSGSSAPVFITLNGSDFATTSSGTLTAATYAVSNGALVSSSINDIQAASTTVTAASTKITALRFAAKQDSTVTLSSTSTVSFSDGNYSGISGGAILVASSVGAHATVITGGTIKAGQGSVNSDLDIIQNNTQGVLEIDSAIIDYTKMASLTKSGQGTLVLGGANTYSGATFINEGTLVAATRSSLTTGSAGGWTAANLSVAAGATLGLSVNATNGFTVSDIATILALGTGTTGLLNGSYLGIDTTNAQNDNFTYSSVIANANSGANSIGITKMGTGMLTLGGANTYTGATNIQNGIVSISTVGTGTAAQGLGSGTAVNLGVAATSSGTLQYTGAAGSLDKAIYALGSGLNTIQNSGGGLLTLSGSLVKNGTILVLNGGSGGITVSGVISGTSANSDLYITGGTTTLTAVNTYNGPTWVYGNGVLVNGNTSGALPVATTLILGGTDNSNGTFDLNGNGQTVAGLSSQGTGANTVTNNGAHAATLTVTGSGAYGGVIADGTSATALKLTGGNLVLGGVNTYTGATTLTGGTLSVNGSLADSAVNISSVAALNGTGTINGAVVNSGTISGALTFANDVTINPGGTAAAAAFNGNIVDNGAITSAFTVQTGKTLSGSGTAASTVTVNSGTLNGSGLNLQGTTNLNGSSTVSGYNIANVVNVNGAATLTGTTTASTKLSVNTGGSLNNNGVVQGTVDAAGLLKGNGTLIGAVTVSGTLAPGDGIGTTTIQGSLSMGANAVLAMDVTGAGAGEADAVKVSGNITLAGTLDLRNLSGLGSGDIITLVENIGTDATLGHFTTILTSGGTFNISDYSNTYSFTVDSTEYLLSYGVNAGNDNQYNDVTLAVMVPEPSTWAMLVGSLGLLAFGQRLRRGKFE